MIYGLRDTGTCYTEYRHRFGVVRRDFTPKSAFSTIRELFESYRR